MIGRSSVGKAIDDKVFAITDKAKQAISKYGKENVINGTIGVLYDDDEKLVSFETVVENYRSLEPEDIFAYAKDVDGTSEYKEAVKHIVLGENYNELFEGHFIAVNATVGGTGAIRNSLQNYLNPGEKVLIPHLMWGPYKLIPEEVGGSFETYRVFNDKDEFDLEDFKSKVNGLLEVQENVVIMINDPCHNPTGFSLSIPEWKEVLDFLQECSKKKNIILLNDIAYIDFSRRDMDEYRKLFRNLSENLFVIFLFSMSKSMTSYGLRAGAQVALSTSKEVIREFADVTKFSDRVTWSNISRGAITLLPKVVLDKDNYSKLLEERNKYKNILFKRAEIFIEEAKKADLDIYPYRDGFFLTIPVKENLDEIVARLEGNKIFTLPVKDGLRIGLCSIPTHKIYGLAQKIKNCL